MAYQERAMKHYAGQLTNFSTHLKFIKTGEQISKSIEGVVTKLINRSEEARVAVAEICKKRELDPKEVIELRGRYQKFVEMSVFPLKHQIEMGSPLLSGKRFDLRAALTVDPGTSHGDFLVSLNLRF